MTERRQGGRKKGREGRERRGSKFVSFVINIFFSVKQESLLR
jgi:hypothetical protein